MPGKREVLRRAQDDKPVLYINRRNALISERIDRCLLRALVILSAAKNPEGDGVDYDARILWILPFAALRSE